MLFLGGGALLGYATKTDANNWIVTGLFFVCAIGLDLAISGMIDTRLEKFKQELYDENH